MHAAGRTDQCVEAADLLEQRANRGAVGDVRTQVATVAADADDVMTLAQFVGHCLAEDSAGADQDDFHGSSGCLGER
ncbi:hypothetical protein D9M71_725200 [compost metagenome]